MTIRPFSVQITDATLDDLRARLRNTRWPIDIGAGWSIGSDIAFVKKLCVYWAEDFNWRAQERFINTHPQFLTEIDGETLHFAHLRAEAGDGLPLLLMNGWPSNFYEPLKMARNLSSGSPAFDVVIPSFPGFGFSPPAKTLETGPSEMAAMFVELMEKLGYPRFIVQGGDVGSSVAEQIRCRFPERLLGAHFTNLQAVHTVSDDPSEEELAYLQHRKRWMNEEAGYIAIQRTKPQTLSFGLTDSPAGMAAWIMEKWRGWSDCGGDPLSVFSLDDICSILTIYWVTKTAESSIRQYRFSDRNNAPPVRKGPVPVAMAAFPKDNMPVVKRRAEAWINLVQYTDMPRGGHFPSLEAPDLLAEDLRAFAKKLTA